MSLSTSSYFSNSIVGTPGLGADIDLYESSSTPKYAVGFGFTRADGNKYRYCHFGGLSNRGTAVSPVGTESNLAKIENVACTVANKKRRAGETLDPNAIGSRYMQLVISATADQFAGGYITVTTNSGSGFTYRVQGNTAAADANPVTGNIYMDLYDPIQVAIDSNSDLIIAGSPYANLVPANVTTVSCATVVGVTVANNTAANFGWICTGGVISALQDANIGIYGEPIMLSTNTVGAIQAFSNALLSPTAIYTQAIIGYLVEAGSSADYSLVKLTIE